jgi:PAS domain S-box-containing protein
MNKLLERQIRKYFSDAEIASPSMQKFIQEVSDTYDDAETDQELMSRSLDISSREMVERDLQQRQIAATNTKAIEMLKSAALTLDPHFAESATERDVIHLAGFLSELTVKYKQNMHELTIQKIHAEALSSELQTFKFAVENAANYITFLDTDLKLVYANKAALAGAKLEDIKGKTIDEAFSLLGLGVQSNTDEIRKNMEQGKKQFIYDYTVAGSYGAAATIENVTTISVDKHHRKLIINIGRDVTEEKALEREKDEFVSIASHELRTPMTVIRGYINLLTREQLGKLNTEQKEILDKMNESTKALIKFVADMLDLSKLGEDKFTIRTMSTSLEDNINSSIEKMRVLFESKNIELKSHTIPAQIKTDPIQFERIMSNLLGNAYKFTPSGGTVTVSNTIDKDKKIATICIADTGIGIPAASLKNLFKKFSQVDNVLQRQSGGSGLGLVISKELVKDMGGTIWAKSEQGRGSQFYFTMPMA